MVPQDVSEDALQMAGNYTLGGGFEVRESWYIVSKGEGGDGVRDVSPVTCLLSVVSSFF